MRKLYSVFAMFAVLCMISAVHAGVVDFTFNDPDEDGVFDVLAVVSGADTAGLAAFSFQATVVDSSAVSFAFNPYLDGLQPTFVPYGFTTQVKGPSGPTFYSAAGAQPTAGPAVFGIGINPVFIDGPVGPPDEAGDINTGVPVLLGTLNMGGQALTAGSLVVDAGLYDLSGVSDGFLPGSAIQTSSTIVIGETSTPGDTQENPILPDGVNEHGAYMFNGHPVPDFPEGLWWDPISAHTYQYEITDGVSKFGSVGLPVGLEPLGDMMYTVSSVQGDFVVGEGTVHNFTGAGVDYFEVRGIDPPVDPPFDTAFPTFLAFSATDGGNVSFTMTPLPEPSTFALLGLGLVALVGYRRKK